MQRHVLILGIVVLAGFLLWSFGALPNQLKQNKLGASIESGITESLSAEIILPVLLEPLQVKAGHEIKVTVGVSLDDAPIFLPIDIYLESSTGLTFAKGSITDIDGEGRRFGSISLPEDAEPGIWKVKTVEITNTQGAIASYSYGTNIFSTFTVE
ncbi:MAG: hypothetical protein Greene101447_497 [Parcubacteria group bacterium Greene1014_47]|nr:MAG: hypothetical protein Greene101447_497 [Parcubacteria group bacterium Greene1014_47]